MTELLAVVLSLFLGSQAAPQAPQPPYGGTGKISGQVVSLDGGKPIVNAQLRLIRWEGGRGSQAAVRSDAQGHFEFTKLLAGQYQLNVTAERYLSLEFGQRGPLDTGRRIELADGQSFDKADFSLPRTSAIEGQVLDEFGDPAPGVTIQVARVDFILGARRLMPVNAPSNTRITDDQGTFRIFNLPPGDYYLLALSGPFVPDPSASDLAGFAPTYFPGTVQPTDAQPIHLGVGQDTRGLNFALQPAAMARFTGAVVDVAGSAVANGMILLAQIHNGDVRTQIIAISSTASDGSFLFRNVAPGSYVVQAFGAGGIARGPFGSVTATIDGADVPLRVTVRPGVFARGRIVLDGDASTLRPSQISVFPRPIDFISAPIAGGGAPSGTVRDDWTFEVVNMNGRRIVTVNIGSPMWVVKQVALNGKDVTEEPIDFRSGDVEGIEITLTNKISAVTGTVSDDGKPVTDYSVVVFSENSARWTPLSRYVATSRSTTQGSFRVQGLPPERYLAVALTSVQGSQWQDPEFLNKLRALATPFTLSEAENMTLTLKLVK